MAEAALEINGEQERQEIAVLYLETIDIEGFYRFYGYPEGSKKIKDYHNIIISSIDSHLGTIIKLTDDHISASFRDPIEAVKSAIRILFLCKRYNRTAFKAKGLNFKVSVHSGKGIIEDKEILGRTFNILPDMINRAGPWEIVISEPVYEHARRLEGFRFKEIAQLKDGVSFLKVYRTIWEGELPPAPAPIVLKRRFQYRYELIEGIYQPCFYCSSKSHLPSDCPSKYIPETTDAIERLKYQSIEGLNHLFSEILTRGGKWEGLENLEGLSDEAISAHHLFYEIKRVHQLRFFQALMTYRGNDWRRTKRLSAEGVGGNLWIACDCIRTKNYTQAESLLKALFEEKPNDFAINCALGYLNIEKGHHMSAVDYFKNAYRWAETTPRKIFLLLLLSRAHHLFFNDADAAWECIRQIRGIEKDCDEAAYLDIIMRLKTQRDAQIGQQLRNLIKRNPLYYTIAVIDPEFIGNEWKIEEELDVLYEEAKREATRLLHEVEVAVEGVRSWLVVYDAELEDLEDMLSSVHLLFDSDSYMGYIEIAYRSHIIIAEATSVENKYRGELNSLLFELKERLAMYSDFFYRNIDIGLSALGIDKIETLKEELARFESNIGTSMKYKEALAEYESLSTAFVLIEKLKNDVIRRRDAISFILGASIKGLIVFIFTTFFCFVLMPLIDYYVEAFFKVHLLSSFKVSDFKWGILLISGLVSIILGITMESIRVIKKDRP